MPDPVFGKIRALPWWALAMAGLLILFMLGWIGDGYVLRTLGAAAKTAIGAAMGYYLHLHLVCQGQHIPADDQTAAAQSKRQARAILMAGTALAMALAV